MIQLQPHFGALKRLLRSHSLHLALMLVIPYACVIVGLDVAAHYGDATGAALPWQFFLSQDRSFGEFLEYALTGSAAVLLMLLWRRTGALVYFTSAVLFFYLTLDNFAELHEAFGGLLDDGSETFAGLPIAPRHFWETALFGVVGGGWLIGLVIALRAADKRAASYAIILSSCVVAAAFFGVGVDLVTSWGDHSPEMLNLLAFIEDEGEFAMIIASFAVCVGIYDLEGRRKAAPDMATSGSAGALPADR